MNIIIQKIGDYPWLSKYLSPEVISRITVIDTADYLMKPKRINCLSLHGLGASRSGMYGLIRMKRSGKPSLAFPIKKSATCLM